VIYVSGESAHERQAKGVENSIMIAKPFTIGQLVVAMASLLESE
jgi:DNA-binding response OmpR family regulator